MCERERGREGGREAHHFLARPVKGAAVRVALAVVEVLKEPLQVSVVRLLKEVEQAHISKVHCHLLCVSESREGRELRIHKHNEY